MPENPADVDHMQLLKLTYLGLDGPASCKYYSKLTHDAVLHTACLTFTYDVVHVFCGTRERILRATTRIFNLTHTCNLPTTSTKIRNIIRLLELPPVRSFIVTKDLIERLLRILVIICSKLYVWSKQFPVHLT